ncbi:egalitarian protein homolog [Macrosteles quadrilineatus]|uniref:egalitarian protein homolog n=1 Tax=Macrosteles quadrilineatus TaxID=74068 RepID=UPI0023E2DB72|nr:egalitarian protein homolog [Macrosteles quadrilineatus]
MDSSEYELVRNMTLLFFFERLMDKGGPRTLHDLSCQFGAKGFTKEMRQIAGGSQSGLKKFLAQYPSLFIVDGDYVSINSFMSNHTEAEDTNSSSRPNLGKRDYVQEAVEYFSSKLRQYGVGTEVPIKSLLGHRSQASPEVRHISGQHVREFRDFLCKYPEAFIVSEDTVMLKEYEGKEPQPFCELENVKLDPDVTYRLLDFFKKCIEVKGPMLVDQLFHHVVSFFPQDLWFGIFKTSQDLSTFLKMHSNMFTVQANLVNIIQTPNKVAEINSINKPNVDNKFVDNDANTIINNNQNNNMASLKLSPLNQESNEKGSVSSAGVPNQNLSLKQRINSLVMKTLADNTEKDRNLAAASVNNGLGANNTDNWKNKIVQSTRVIANIKESLQIIEEVMRKSPSAISFDCEGINLGIKGQLTLFQIGLPSGQAYIFDLITCPSLVTSGGLQKLLESDNVIKVIHDCRNDSVNLYNQFGITLRNVFDTQAAHAVLQLQQTGKPVYKVKNISLNALCELYEAPINPMKEQLKNVYRRDQRFWARRPLTREMMMFAAADVLSLVPHVYNAMLKQIHSEWEGLLAELCEEQVYMHIRPTEVKQRKKQRKVESEVSDLRSKLSSSSQSGRNIVLSNREIRLLRYLDLTDEEKEKLKGSYKVARKLEKLEGRMKDGEDGDGEYPSLDSYNSGKSTPSDNSLSGEALSPCSGPRSLTESMQQMDDILSDTGMDRLDKMERLEALLTAAVTGLGGGGGGSRGACDCQCHSAPTADSTSQTLSTGDIVITRIHFNEEDQEKERTLLCSPKH